MTNGCDGSDLDRSKPHFKSGGDFLHCKKCCKFTAEIYSTEPFSKITVSYRKLARDLWERGGTARVSE